MKSWANTKFEKFLLALLALRFAALAVGSFLILGFPDIWRQVVTLGVSMRYWSRWAIETGAQQPLLPAILDSGDASGIMPMEFPILNLLTAPCFALGPHLGRAFAIILYNVMMFGLVLLNARTWKGKKIAGIEVYAAMLLVPIFSIGLRWSGKFMPDFPSIILVCLAIGLSWTESRPIRSFAIAAIGMLMKPTAVIVFLLLLAHRNPVRKSLSTSLWAIPAVGLTALYYTAGMSYIGRFQEVSMAIGIQRRSLMVGLVEFLHHPGFIFHFYFQDAFFGAGLLLVFGIAVWSWRARKSSPPWLLWLVSLLQFLAVTMIDGGNLFYDHLYYLLGLGPILCLLYVDAWNRCEKRPVRALLALGIVIPLIEICLMDLKPIYRTQKDPYWSLDQQAQELRERNPSFPWRQGKAFRSSSEPYPLLGLHFGEITGSTRAPYGFFYKEGGLSAGCKRVDETAVLMLARCE